ncbi:hypothetical protein [Lentilactobacillus kisonensis]|uniref:Uncharacterized protein n=1 Tax=Lentilactobacillus kisonensis F0435 TaxID=797516 RepID=H1LKB9_9LACO|nr:hypothetical protein [Lentilactobacillus kisonensis]EHO47593.1 hypothetical protein HMPREF9104_03065 [Lentilactobacillus kisonensis F0435]
MVKLLKPRKDVLKDIDEIADEITVDDLARLMGLPSVEEMKRRQTKKAEPRVGTDKEAKSE